MAITKRLKQRVYSSFYKRSIKEVVEGAELEWRGDATLLVVNKILDQVGKIGSAMVAGTARALVPRDTRNLHDSIKAKRSIFYRNASDAPVTEFLIEAGDNQDIDYAFQVEAGRYYKTTGTRVPAVPFMRQAFAKNKQKIRQMFINRLKSRLS